MGMYMPAGRNETYVWTTEFFADVQKELARRSDIRPALTSLGGGDGHTAGPDLPPKVSTLCIRRGGWQDSDSAVKTTHSQIFFEVSIWDQCWCSSS